MSVGELIKQYIEENGMKQVHVARKSLIPEQSFNAICNGKQRMTAEQYFAVCDALGVPCDYFKVEQKPMHQYAG